MLVIGLNHFNKYLTLDIENRLMLYLSSVDQVERVQNRRGNPQNQYYTSEELEENARVMKNNGYYSGPKGAFYNNDGTDAPRYSASVCVTHYNQNDLMRRKICNVEVKANTHHTIRLRSVLSSSESGNFVLDYMELVPIDICGAGGLGEDLY